MTASAQNVLGTNRTAIVAGGLANKLLSGLNGAKIQAVLDDYTIASNDLAVASTIKMCANLPKGANIIAILLSVSAAQSSATFDVGDGASSTRYASASTGLQSAVPTVTVIAGLNYVIGTATNDNCLLLTTAGATLTAGVLHAVVLYTLD